MESVKRPYTIQEEIWSSRRKPSGSLPQFCWKIKFPSIPLSSEQEKTLEKPLC